MIPALQQAHARWKAAKKLKHRSEDHYDGPCAACDELHFAEAALLALDTSAGETPQGPASAFCTAVSELKDREILSPPETPTIRPSAPQDQPQLMRRNMSKLLDKLYGLHYRPGHLDSVMDVVQAFAVPEVASAPQTVSTEGLEEQIERLATFIMENIPGEPSQSEGAVDCAIRLLRPLASAPPQGWQPIATAPKDGQRLLLWWPYWSAGPVIGRWFNGDWDSRWKLEGEGLPPTHWHRVPAPPVSDREETGQ